jgi:glycogen debranching enzyme
MKSKVLLSVAAAAVIASACCTTGYKTDEIGINVTPSENREYSYTDKKSGYWYGRTHQVEPQEWYSGWNMAKKRVLSDYALNVDGQDLNRTDASCVVYPDRLVRQWSNAVETFQLVDNLPIIYIGMETEAQTISCSLNLGLIAEVKATPEQMLFIPHEDKTNCIMLAPAKDVPYTVTENGISTTADAGGFILTYGNPAKCQELAETFRKNGEKLLQERKERINSLVTEFNPVKSNLPDLDKALDWITITMDELITCQQGNGIYAGLPWFNEYWGRDMFISMPGACLVTGQFEVAKDILRDFAKLQDTDPKSETYGRIPNRANLEGILYNTTDGTPRFVIQAYELAQYSGDTEFLADLYPAIKMSIDASIANYTDEKGYLTHADADTWMDVKRNGIPGSPRGNRANDIQALWYGQLMAGAKIAAILGEEDSAEQWSGIAQMLAANFENDFCNKEGNMVYDHLNSDGSADMQLRPNQLYCFDLINDDDFKQKVTRSVWEELVYPWGVASLAQWDPQFHPQHENWHYYHKDDAYHNGTIWLWNNGIAMQRMIEYGQVDTAWELFKNMNRQALVEGAVGSLSENADAHPREGKTWVNRSGTFLQAWSNAEHLRVWYQHFLGIRPDLLQGVIVIEPRIPSEIKSIETSVKVGDGTLHYSYKNGRVNVKLEGCDATLDIRKPAGHQTSPIFEGVKFCEPKPLENYPCFNTYYETALTY